MDAGTIFDDRAMVDTMQHMLQSGINMEYIGETHQALEQELDYQTFLEDELKTAVARGIYSQQDAENFQTLININREHLESLSPITSLEHMFSEISQKVSDRALDLTRIRDSPAFWDRNLSKNMRACWKTVQRFSYVSRVHISNASEYQMFYYNCDHFMKSLQKKSEANSLRYSNIDIDYPGVTTSRLNTFMNEGLGKFQSLGTEIMRLMDKAQRINPIYLRVRPLARPVSGIMLCDYSTKNFSLRAGQHVIVLDNAYVTPLNSSSEVTDASEASECSTCSQCCPIHRHHPHDHGTCENCGLPVSSTTETSTEVEMGENVVPLQGEETVEAPMRHRAESESSTATGTLSSTRDASTTVTSPGCSHTFCSQKDPVMWKVQTRDGKLTVDVPAVTVMINEQDDEAISHSFEIYEFFTSMWRDAIDIWLRKGVKALSTYFSYLLDAKYLRFENQRVFEQLLEEIERAFPVQGPDVSSANRILNELITSLREKITHQTTYETMTEETYISITEVATYRKTVQSLRDHAKQIKRFMKDVEDRTGPGAVDSTALRTIGDLKYVYEESIEKHRKLERMMRQVKALRSQPRTRGIPLHKVQTTYGEYYSSSEEITSGSESSDSQYDVQRSQGLTREERILYGTEERHRETALTDRPRYLRRPHRPGTLVEVEDLPTDSSEESDKGQGYSRRSSRLIYKPSRPRTSKHISEVIEETNDTVISSMTLNRKINLEKPISRHGVDVSISPDGLYRSRRQLHVTAGQPHDVSMVYLQITTAKSTQDAIEPMGVDKQSRGIQLDIFKVPVDAKDVLYVEPRVASWQSDSEGTLRLKHDVSLEPMKEERERPVAVHTMEAIVSGGSQSGDFYERGVQMTSHDEYEGILKPLISFTTQTPSVRHQDVATMVETAEPIIRSTVEEKPVFAMPPQPETPKINTVITSLIGEPSRPIDVSSGMVVGQIDASTKAPVPEITGAVSSAIESKPESATAVTTEPLPRYEDAWTEPVFFEDTVPFIKPESTVGVKTAPPQPQLPLMETTAVQAYGKPTEEQTTSWTGEPRQAEEISSGLAVPRYDATVMVQPAAGISRGVETMIYEEPEPLRPVVTVPTRSAPPAPTPMSFQTCQTYFREPSQLEVTSKVEVTPTRVVIGSNEAPSIRTSSTATLTDVRIEPAKEVVVHTVPPIEPAKGTVSSEWAPQQLDMGTWEPTTPREKDVVDKGTETLYVVEPAQVVRTASAQQVYAAPPPQIPEVVVKRSLVETPYRMRLEGVFTGEVERPSEAQTSFVELPVPAKVVLATASSQVSYVPELYGAVTEVTGPSKPRMVGMEVQVLGDIPRPKLISTATITDTRFEPAAQVTSHVTAETEAAWSEFTPIHTDSATVAQETPMSTIGISTEKPAAPLDAWVQTLEIEAPVPVVREVTQPIQQAVRPSLTTVEVQVYGEAPKPVVVERPKPSLSIVQIQATPEPGYREITSHVVKGPKPIIIAVSTDEAQATDAQIPAPESGIVSTVTSVTRTAAPVVSRDDASVMTTSPDITHRGTETAMVAEPVLTIQPQRIVEVHTEPPKPITVRYIISETPVRKPEKVTTHVISTDSKQEPITSVVTMETRRQIDEPVPAPDNGVLSAVTADVAPKTATQDLAVNTIPVDYVNRGTETLYVEEPIAPIRPEKVYTVKSEPPAPTPMSVGLVNTPRYEYHEGVTTGEIPKSRLVDKEVYAYTEPERPVYEIARTQVVYAGEPHVTVTQEIKPSLDSTVSAMVTAPKSLRSVEVQAYEVPKPVLEAVKPFEVESASIQAYYQPETMSTATLTDMLFEPTRTTVQYAVPPAPKRPEVSEMISSSLMPRSEEAGTIAAPDESKVCISSLTEEQKPMGEPIINVVSTGPLQHADAQIPAAERPYSSTVTTMTTAPELVNRGVETLHVEEPAPIIAPARVEVVKSEPPAHLRLSLGGSEVTYHLPKKPEMMSVVTMAELGVKPEEISSEWSIPGVESTVSGMTESPKRMVAVEVQVREASVPAAPEPKVQMEDSSVSTISVSLVNRGVETLYVEEPAPIIAPARVEVVKSEPPAPLRLTLGGSEVTYVAKPVEVVKPLMTSVATMAEFVVRPEEVSSEWRMSQSDAATIQTALGVESTISGVTEVPTSLATIGVQVRETTKPRIEMEDSSVGTISVSLVNRGVETLYVEEPAPIIAPARVEVVKSEPPAPLRLTLGGSEVTYVAKPVEIVKPVMTSVATMAEFVVRPEEVSSEYRMPGVESTISGVTEAPKGMASIEVQVYEEAKPVTVAIPQTRVCIQSVATAPKAPMMSSATLTDLMVESRTIVSSVSEAPVQKGETMMGVVSTEAPQQMDVQVPAPEITFSSTITSMTTAPEPKPQMEFGSVNTTPISLVNRGVETLYVEEPAPIIEPQRVEVVKSVPPAPLRLSVGGTEVAFAAPKKPDVMTIGTMVELAVQPEEASSEWRMTQTDAGTTLTAPGVESVVTGVTEAPKSMSTVEVQVREEPKPAPAIPKQTVYIQAVSTAPKAPSMSIATLTDAKEEPKAYISSITEAPVEKGEPMMGIVSTGPLLHTDAQVPAAETPFSSTVTSMIVAPEPKAQMEYTAVNTTGAQLVNRGVETLYVEEPAPIIAPQRVEVVKSEPPAPIRLTLGGSEVSFAAPKKPEEVSSEWRMPQTDAGTTLTMPGVESTTSEVTEAPKRMATIEVQVREEPKPVVEITKQPVIIQAVSTAPKPAMSIATLTETVAEPKTLVSSGIEAPTPKGEEHIAIITTDTSQVMDAQTPAPGAEVVSTVTSVAAAPKALTESKEVLMKSEMSSLGTQTIVVEEPVPIIEPARVVEVHEQPPAPVYVKFVQSQTPEQLQREVTLEHMVKPYPIVIASTETVTMRTLEHVSIQTDSTVPALQSRAATTSEYVAAPRSPKLSTKSGYAQILAQVPTLAKPVVEDKGYGTEPVVRTEKSIRTEPEPQTDEATSTVEPKVDTIVSTRMEMPDARTTVTSFEKTPEPKVRTEDYGTMTDAAPATVSRGTEAIEHVEEPVPIFEVAKTELTHTAPPMPVEIKSLTVQNVEVAKKSLISTECQVTGAPREVSVTSLDVQKPRLVVESLSTMGMPVSTTVVSSEMPKLSLQSVEMSTIAEPIPAPVPVPLSYATASIPERRVDIKSTATITDSQIEPVKEAVQLLSVPPSQPLAEYVSELSEPSLLSTTTEVASQPTKTIGVVFTEEKREGVNQGVQVSILPLESTVTSATVVPTYVKYMSLESPKVRSVDTAVLTSVPFEPKTVITSLPLKATIKLASSEVKLAPTYHSTVTEITAPVTATKPALVSTEVQGTQEATTERIQPTVVLGASTSLTEVQKPMETASVQATGLVILSTAPVESTYEQPILAVPSQPVVEAEPPRPTILKFGDAETDKPRIMQTATMTSHEYAPTKPQLMAIAKPATSDVSTFATVEPEVRLDASSQAFVAPPTHAAVTYEVPTSPLTAVSGQATEAPKPTYVATFEEVPKAPLTIASSNTITAPESQPRATMTEARIEPTQQVMVHSVPPAAPNLEALSSEMAPQPTDKATDYPRVELAFAIVSYSAPKLALQSVEIQSIAPGVPRMTTISVMSETVPMQNKSCQTQPSGTLTSTSAMTTSEIQPVIEKPDFAAPPVPVVIAKPQTTESTMQTLPKPVQSIVQQTDESEFIWEVEMPTTVKYFPVETAMRLMKNRTIQCSLSEAPVPVKVEEDKSQDFDIEKVVVDETYYQFRDTQAAETNTSRLRLIEWAEFSPSTGFRNDECNNEFYELFHAVRQSVWNRCVDDELSQFFTNVGYGNLDSEIYREIVNRRYLWETYTQVEETREERGVAEFGLQFPYETVVEEPFHFQESVTEEVLEESYWSKIQRGVISEAETDGVPKYTTEYSVQVELMPEPSAPIEFEISRTEETVAYAQPRGSGVDFGDQTDLDYTSTYLIQKTDRETQEAMVTDIIDIVEEPVYMKTQVTISTVTEAAQTEPLSYDYLTELLSRFPRPEPITRLREDCLHDLDITTYFFDEDAHEAEFYQREQEEYLTATHEKTVMEKMKIQIRQRVVEYELCDMTTHIDARNWNDIREVASPITGLFAPVSFAIRQGWIALGERNEYIDPTTGHAIPLETALAQGRIRLDSSQAGGSITPSLMLIERESIVNETVDAILVLNTISRRYLPINQARDEGLIRVDEHDIPWVLNSADNTWVSAEEAISQGILKLDPVIDQETEEEVRRRQQQSIVRAYHVTAVRPGGEPSEWLRPEDAIRLGLFNRQTGVIASDWPTRPSYEAFEDRRGEVTMWCNFLTARQAGWIRLVEEMNVNKWIPLSQPGGSSGNRRLLSSSVSLFSGAGPRLDAGRPDPYRSFERRRTGHVPSGRRHYQTQAAAPMGRTEGGSESQSPIFSSETSRTPPFLTEVGEFEHTDVYTLPSTAHRQMEGVSETPMEYSERNLEDADSKFYAYPATVYPADESVSSFQQGFEEIRSYTDPNRGIYMPDQSWSRSRQFPTNPDEQSGYSRSGYPSRSSEHEHQL